MSRVKIVIADDHPLILRAVRHSLQQAADFEVVGEGADGEEAVRLTDQLQPHVVIMDMKMPKLGGLEATRQIKARHPSVVVLALTAHDEDEYVLGALWAGVDGYLLKTASAEMLTQAVRAVLVGDAVLHPVLCRKLLRRAARHRPVPVPSKAESLTAREVEVLQLVTAGISNEGISDHLGIRVCTVKGHLREIFAKMRVGSRTQAALQALKLGYVKAEDTAAQLVLSSEGRLESK